MATPLVGREGMAICTVGRWGVGRVGLCVGLVLVASVAFLPRGPSGHDEDWRKLANLQPPVYGPLVRGPHAERGGRIGEFDAHNVTLLAWMPLNLFPDSQVSANDCWGYVSPSGREYIIIGLRKGFAVVEVTNPTLPEIVGYIPGSTSLWRDVKVLGHYAYGVSEGGLGIRVIDLREVDDGIVTHVRNKMQNGHATTHNIAVNPDSGYLYLCGANIANGGLIAVSTADPTNPVIAGAWSTRYVHDAQVVTYTDGPYAGREIAFCCNGSAGLDIVDVTNKSNMFRMGGIKYPGTRYCHQGWLTEDRKYFLINDEMDEPDVVETTTTHVIDVTNLSSPKFVGTFTSGTTSTDHNLYIHNGVAYEANYTSGLRIFDVTALPDAVQIGWFDTYPAGDAPGYHGAWSCYPYLPSGTIAISDIQRGLFLVRLGTDSIGFEFPESLPTMLRPEVPEPIVAEVFGQGVELDASSVMLHVRRGGEVADIAMAPGQDGTFVGALPGMDCYDEADFWLSASDTEGLRYTDPPNAYLGSGYPVMVSTGSTEIYSDDFSEDAGWTVSDLNVISGSWARTTPVRVNDYEPPNDFDGSDMAWVTGETPGEFLIGGPTRLDSPPFDLNGYGAAEATYAVWHQATSGSTPVTVSVSADGVNWVKAATHLRTSGWEEHSIRIDRFVPLTDQVRLRFSAASMNQYAGAEVGVDAVRIRRFECVPCIADYNRDGVVNTQDFVDFLNDFTGSTDNWNPDINGDTIVDSRDFLAFLTAYTTGCP